MVVVRIVGTTIDVLTTSRLPILPRSVGVHDLSWVSRCGEQHARHGASTLKRELQQAREYIPVSLVFGLNYHSTFELAVGIAVKCRDLAGGIAALVHGRDVQA